MIMNGLAEDHQPTREHLGQIIQQGVWSIQRAGFGS